MVVRVRSAENENPKEIINKLKQEYKPSLIDAIIGSGEKKLAASEKENYLRTNRTLHALVELKKGTVLTDLNCALLRTEKVLRPGIAPKFFKEVLGTKVKKNIPDGEGIEWHDLL